MLNLYDLYKRASPYFSADAAVTDGRAAFDGVQHLGLVLPPGSHITLRRLQELRPLERFPDRTGWTLFASLESERGLGAAVKLTDSLGGQAISSEKITVSKAKPFDVLFPWPTLAVKGPPLLDLAIEADPENSGALFLSVTPLQDRQELIRLCQGVGVEIGPGTNPQVLSAPGVEVTYCDEMDREEWERAYAYKKKTWEGRTNSTPWHLYRRASADELPVSDNSLDFIFASHVFEHLVNPLGHIEHWLAKLRPGGVIVAIVPNAESSVDYSRPLSTLPEIVSQQDGPMRPGLEHYACFFGEKEAERRLKEKRSFHAHFYTPENLGALLSHAVKKNGLAWYQIQHRGNYHEIFFICGKPADGSQIELRG